MNIVVEKQPKCIATLHVDVPADHVQGQREKIVRSYVSKVRLPGFRPGKAPRHVVEKRFLKEITEELNEQLVNEAFDEALKQEDLKVLDFGNPDDITTMPDGSITFSSRLTLAPEFQLPEYKGIKVTVPPLDVPDEDLQSQLANLQERFAEYKDIEGRPAAPGDFAVIDYSSTVEGQPTEEFLGKPAGYLAGREGFWVRIDEKTFLPGFALQLEGMTPGDTKEIKVTLPEDFPVEDLRNRELTFTTTLKELKESILPELNDEFAARLVPGKSLDEITSIVRENMQNERKRRIDDMKVNQIVEHFNSQLEFDIPDELVTRETQSQADAMVRRGIEAGLSEDEIEAQQVEIFASAGNQAMINLRTNFILGEIARAENIKVSDTELLNHLVRVAESRKTAPKKMIKELQRAGRLPSIRHSITIGKTIDFLVEHAEVVESQDTAIPQD